MASVQDSIDAGRVAEETGPRASRNRLQTTTLLDAIAQHGFDAAFGGARRDEERARAKERIFSFRNDFGGWDPRNQRPEIWDLYNGRIGNGENVRVFPISNWTELNVWRYIAHEDLELPSIYFAHEREVFARDGMLYATSPRRSCWTARRRSPRGCATAPWATCRCTGAVESTADAPRGRGDRDRRHPGHRAGRDPRRRPRQRGGDGGSQEGGLLLSRAPPPSERGELLRLATAGSVDDGKSTLIGRLLYDSKSILQDQLDAVELASRRRTGNGTVDLSLLTDGLRAEREQGITIDVAYRYFATPRRTFIIADTPGHVLYTRNMVTGASTADLAIVLVDARNGVVEQSRRHAFLASLLRVPHLVLAVNKMDLVDWDEDVFTRIVDDFSAFATKLEITDITVRSRSRPCSATTSSTAPRTCPGTRAPPLLYHLEHVHIASDRNLIDARLPVQWVIRPGTRRSITTTAGSPASSPAGSGGRGRGPRPALRATSRVKSLETPDGPLEEAFRPCRSP